MVETLTVTEDLTPEQLEVLEDRIYEFNMGATGITDGDLLRGVHYRAGGCTTQSIVMRSKSGTVRMIDGYHRLTKLREYSSVDFDLTDEQLAADPVPPLP